MSFWVLGLILFVSVDVHSGHDVIQGGKDIFLSVSFPGLNHKNGYPGAGER